MPLAPATGIFVRSCGEDPTFLNSCVHGRPGMIDLGKQQAREDLNNIAQWIADNKFPGYSERVEEISLPKWMLPKEDGTPADHQPIELY